MKNREGIAAAKLEVFAFDYLFVAGIFHILVRAAGIISENDVDIIPARALCVEVVTAPAFEVFTEREAEAARAVIDKCRAVADCGAVYGVVNRENARLLDYARERGKRIITSPDETAEACGI